MHPDMFSAFEDIAGDTAAPIPVTKSPDHRPSVRRQRRRVRSLRSLDGDHRPRCVHRRHRMVRHQRRQPAAMTRRRRRIRCARWAAPTASSARWSPSPASTTGRSRRMRSRPRCRGWPVRSARQTSRRSRCPIHRRPRPSPRRRRRRTCRRPRNRGLHTAGRQSGHPRQGRVGQSGVNSFHSPGTPLSTWAPRSLNVIPEP